MSGTIPIQHLSLFSSLNYIVLQISHHQTNNKHSSSFSNKSHSILVFSPIPIHPKCPARMNKAAWTSHKKTASFPPSHPFPLPNNKPNSPLRPPLQTLHLIPLPKISPLHYPLWNVQREQPHCRNPHKRLHRYTLSIRHRPPQSRCRPRSTILYRGSELEETSG
jgi:hypothetical protein